MALRLTIDCSSEDTLIFECKRLGITDYYLVPKNNEVTFVFEDANDYYTIKSEVQSIQLTRQD